MSFTVAIDGPAASGKGTIARAIGEEFGFAHLDTGLLYRAVGMQVNEGADPLEAALNLSPEQLARGDLRGEVAGLAASKVAAIPDVRAALLTFQKTFAMQEPGAVLDGRDIGTVVCPNADLKLFVTASDVVRARRRWQEEQGRGSTASYEAILEEVRQRDLRDSERAVSPLRPASDALIMDTSELSIAQAVQNAISAVRARR